MEARGWRSPAAAEAEAEDAGGVGAGGPSRLRPRRGLHRAAPYGQASRRWLPKLPVASRILPSSSREPAPSAEHEQEDRHELFTVMPEIQSAKPSSDATANGGSTSTNNKANLLLQSDYRNPNDGSGLAEIENIIKQRTFSRDETERLIELMRSRTPDLCHEDQHATRLISKGFEATPFSKDLDSLATPAQSVDFQSSWTNRVLANSNVNNVGSSPIEIAKAYMEAQNSASIHESQRRKFRALSHGVGIEDSAAKLLLTEATMSPVCWPGSVVQDYPNYLTPQTSRRKTVPQTLSRTPYSGSVFPRSIKHAGYQDNYGNSLSGRMQLSTPFPVSSKAMAEDEITSVDGVHGVQASTSSKGTHVDNISTSPFFLRESSVAMKNLPLNLQSAHGKGVTENGLKLKLTSKVDNMSKCVVGSVHPKSSQTAHKILQHLERTFPSPTAKPLELSPIAARRAATSVVRRTGNEESSSAYQELSDAKKVQASPSSSNMEFIPRIQSSISNSEVPSFGHPFSSKSDLTSTSSAAVMDQSTSNGFTFPLPVTTASNSLLEPPPTPTMASPQARSLLTDAEDIPKFSFGSASSTNDLVFSFNSESSSVSVDTTIPTFKFGSNAKRDLSFDLAGTDTVCF